MHAACAPKAVQSGCSANSASSGTLTSTNPPDYHSAFPTTYQSSTIECAEAEMLRLSAAASLSRRPRGDAFGAARSSGTMRDASACLRSTSSVSATTRDAPPPPSVQQANKKTPNESET